MKGFKIVCKSERGEEVLLKDVNANKKIFKVEIVKEKPFLIVEFMLKGFLRKAYAQVPSESVVDSIKKAMISHGATEQDFEISVIE